MADRTGTGQAPIAAIRRNPRQPRQTFDPARLKELADSIRAHGVLQPLVVAIDPTDSLSPQGGTLRVAPHLTSFDGIVAPQGGIFDGKSNRQYTLIAGERRLEAAKLAGLASVPIILREASDQQLLELALVENLQREELGPLEAAHAYKHLVEEFNLSHDEIAARVGKNRVTVTNAVRLLKLPVPAQEALAAGSISEGHARALLALPSAQAIAAALATIVAKSLNVRQAEELVRQILGPTNEPTAPRRRAASTGNRAKPSRSAEVRSLENRLRDSLGTKVTLNKGRKGGTLVVHFYSDEELNAIADRLLGDK